MRLFPPTTCPPPYIHKYAHTYRIFTTRATGPVVEGSKLVTKTKIADERLAQRTETGIDGSKAAFDKTVTTARWLCTSGLRYFLPFWYSRSPMFWLPHGWFPYYAEWIISFPRAPMGSVSVASWQLACTGVITLVADTIAALVGLVVAAKEAGQGKKTEEPVKASAAPTASAKSQGEGDGKKEL